jgi:hypothetical protein
VNRLDFARPPEVSMACEITLPTSVLAERLETARRHAFNGGVPIRRKDGKLYALLAECLAICEEVNRAGLFEELRQLSVQRVDQRRPRGEVTRAESNNGKGRRYVEAGSDAFILVARYVLAGVDGRNSHYRYATTMREAAKRGIRSGALVDWLGANGGVNALYRPTTLKGNCNQTRQLYLNERITFPREGEFTLTLCHDGKGFFDVVRAAA